MKKKTRSSESDVRSKITDSLDFPDKFRSTNYKRIHYMVYDPLEVGELQLYSHAYLLPHILWSRSC